MFMGYTINKEIDNAKITLSKKTKEKEISLEYIKLAINILMNSKGHENKNLRQWAVEVINKLAPKEIEKMNTKVLEEVKKYGFSNSEYFHQIKINKPWLDPISEAFIDLKSIDKNTRNQKSATIYITLQEYINKETNTIEKLDEKRTIRENELFSFRNGNINYVLQIVEINPQEDFIVIFITKK